MMGLVEGKSIIVTGGGGGIGEGIARDLAAEAGLARRRSAKSSQSDLSRGGHQPAGTIMRR